MNKVHDLYFGETDSCYSSAIDLPYDLVQVLFSDTHVEMNISVLICQSQWPL